MKYWKKNDGSCGVVDDGGFVPDSVKITKREYNTYVDGQRTGESMYPIIEYEDVDTGKTTRLRRIS